MLLGREPSNGNAAPAADLFERANELVSAGHGTRLAASLVAVGETFTVIARDPGTYYPEDANDPPFQRLQTLIQRNKLQICWAGHHGAGGGRRFHQNFTNVLAAAPGVGLADVLIVTCALSCPTAELLYTTDAKLIQNATLRKLGRRSGGRTLEIVEAP